METLLEAKKRHLLVIDDDPVFRGVIAQIAKRRGVNVTVCSSLREIEPMTVPRLFDAAIVDYYLDDMKAHLRGTEVARAMESTPTVLISSSSHGMEESGTWPTNVRRFLNKSAGAGAILDEALAVTS